MPRRNGNGNGNGRVPGQLRLPGLSLKIRHAGTKPPALSTFKLPPLSTTKFECDIDDELQVTVTDSDGNVILGFYVICNDVHLKKHRPMKGQPWLERIHALTDPSTIVELDEIDEVPAR